MHRAGRATLGPEAIEMFVYYFEHVELPFLEAWARLFGALSSLGEWAGSAYRAGESIRAKAGPGGAHLAKEVWIDVGEATASDGTITIPMTWTATGARGLFPKLEADLIVGALSQETTQIALRGTYEPPLGAVGRALDRLALHRVAEATIKTFVDRIALGLLEERDPAAIAGR